MKVNIGPLLAFDDLWLLKAEESIFELISLSCFLQELDNEDFPHTNS